MGKCLVAWIFTVGICSAAEAQSETRPPALWEYGAGVGFIRYFHYPASSQFRDLALPFPTFQYRGEILRADDRDGAKAYLIKNSKWTLDLGGGVLPPLKTEENEARQGMEALPWTFQFGPQFVYEFTEDLHLKLGVYQSILTDFVFMKTNGYVLEQELEFWFDSFFKEHDWREHLPTKFRTKSNFFSKASLSFLSGSRDYLGTYFDVEPKYATAERPSYTAEAGFLGYTLSYFQSFQYEKAAFYFGFADSHYDFSANRKSPLHRSNNNRAVFLGLTYQLGESERRAVPEHGTEGLLQKVQNIRGLEEK